jgi:hypothetical protein
LELKGEPARNNLRIVKCSDFVAAVDALANPKPAKKGKGKKSAG